MAVSLNNAFSTSSAHSAACTWCRHWSAPRNVVVFASHSNPRILKSNRKTRYGDTLSPYDDAADEEIDEDEEEDDYLFSDVSMFFTVV